MISKYKWKTILGLIVMIIATLKNIPWLWGILFLFWAINDLRNGHTYFIEDVSREEDPILFWVIVTVWFLFAVMSFFPSWWWWIYK